MENILKLQDLICKRGPFQLGPLNWQSAVGIFTCLVGPNGAGKTSFLQAVMGLLRNEEGYWEIAGAKIDPRRGAWKEQVGYAFDGQSHHEKLTVRENMEIHAALRRSWDRDFAQELISRFHVDETQLVHRLSRGQRQALSLVKALACRPRLLLLDEVTNGMDSLVRQAWNEIVWRLMAESELTVLMATHTMSDVANLADRLVFLQEGRIVADVEKDALLETWRQLSCRLPGSLTTLPHAKHWEKSGDTLRFISGRAAADMQLLKEKGATHIESQPLSLDEICFYTLEESRHA
ncbi:ATP-binding cassette domain-containing protein [Oligoflexus tunisiensis]|uniref:ATP-binding cassette domain-containing protein n=1 Tax=Oligoflexus tunisiensis TaxID=708132 RepID=UPI00114C87EF|nr:ABC transporter ATP-binding protein [Oligoflexus tunisiensis]